MSYRCGACGGKVPPKQGRRVYVIRYGPRAPSALRGQVARELAVCEECEFRLGTGVALDRLSAEARITHPAEAPPLPAPIPSLVGSAVPFRGRVTSWGSFGAAATTTTM